MFALSGTSWRPANRCLQVAVLVYGLRPRTVWSRARTAYLGKGHPSTQDGRLYTVAWRTYGDAERRAKVALERVRNLARSLGEVSVVARTYDHLTESGGSEVARNRRWGRSRRP